MDLDPTTMLALVLAAGVLAQWLAWRIRLPSIVLLLALGLVAGPVTGAVDPDALLGAQLFPIVSIAVAAILFEGGLSLRLRELDEIGPQLLRLMSIGTAVTWLAIAALGHQLVGLPLELALLFGAICVVTGPTVALPLLQHVRPRRRLAALVKWEGIANDPIGALLAVLVLEWVLARGADSSPLTSLLVALFVGGLAGAAAAWGVGIALRRHWMPDALHGAGVLAVALLVHSLANMAHHEAGLVAVTVMGIGLANQRRLDIEHVLQFGEGLRIVLIGGLFLLLGARVRLPDLALLGPESLLLVALVVFVVRPLAVWSSFVGLRVPWRERLFLSIMAPRGIVAAAVTSLFAIQLTDAGVHQARLLVPLMFLVIFTSVSISGLFARPLALRLGLANRKNDGFLLLGAHPFARAFAESLAAEGVAVVLVDSNRANVTAARLAGLAAHHASIRSDWVQSDLALDGIGHFIGLVPNDEVNSLAALRFQPHFGRANCFQLAPGTRSGETSRLTEEAPARVLFGTRHGHAELERRFAAGARPRRTNLTDDFGWRAFLELHGDGAVPLFVVKKGGGVAVFAADRQLAPEPGDRVVSLVDVASAARAA
ncbi:MAG: cation:proton antiporter [Planctomycetota bacterium]